MPTPLVILFWIWLLISVAIYLSRLFKRASNKSTSDDDGTGGTGGNDATDGDAPGDELPLDSPERWAPAADSQTNAGASTASPEMTSPTSASPAPQAATPDIKPEPAVAAALAEQALDEPETSPGSPVPVQSSPTPVSSEPALPVSELASRLEPLVDESHIEPSVLQAMSPTQRAALGTTAAATGGLFDPQTRAVVLDETTYDHTPLRDLLAGIALPCDLLPTFRTASNDHYAIFTTTSATPPEVAAKVAAELERLGFEVSPRPPAGARAIRATSAVDVIVTMIEETDEKPTHVELEFTSL